MRKLCYALGIWTVLVTLGTVGYEFSSVIMGQCVCHWRIRCQGEDVQLVEWTPVPNLTMAEGWVEEIARIKSGPVIDSEPTEIVQPNLIVLHGRAGCRRSPYGIAVDSYSYSRFAVIVVEFADATRWAKAVELPDPRTAGVIAIDFRTGRQLPPRKADHGR